MNEYSEECLNTFLKEQKKLFDELWQKTWKKQKRFLQTVWLS